MVEDAKFLQMFKFALVVVVVLIDYPRTTTTIAAAIAKAVIAPRRSEAKRR